LLRKKNKDNLYLFRVHLSGRLYFVPRSCPVPPDSPRRLKQRKLTLPILHSNLMCLPFVTTSSILCNNLYITPVV
jgi:hypothetical protein